MRRRRSARLLAALAAAIIMLGLLDAVSMASGSRNGAPQVKSTATSSKSVSLQTFRPDHIVIVVEENHAYKSIVGSNKAPFINKLLKQGAYFTHSYGVRHPSEPNYLALFSGSTQGVKDDSCKHSFSKANLASELLASGLTFAGYSEDLPAIGSTVCYNNGYGRKHNPWSFFTNVPKKLNMPLSAFPGDYSKLPAVSFVIPAMKNDMHDGTITEADSWLERHLGDYAAWAQKHNSLLIVTWDEDDFSVANHIPTLIVGQSVKAGRYDEKINHINMLRTIEDLYGLPHAGVSGGYAPIADIWMKRR